MSTHISAAAGQIAESVLMPGDPMRVKHIAENYLDNAVCYNEVRGMFGYTGTYKGVPVSVQGSGMGMPSMGIYSWELITEYGVQNLIRIGTAGSFHESIRMGDVVMGTAASTDSNYIHAFDAPAGYSPSADFSLIKKALAANEDLGISLAAGNIVSCDVFYETDPKWWHAWAKMGVLAVEMEAAALYMNAAYNQVSALAMVTITDHFVTGEHATAAQREKQNDDMIRLALETVIR
ncbi:MAG: purine-nucleoside phosphorylase [Anaerovoracaceae bacterium]|nr:purine-nucleoside phosphorylase [Anaerovoracaceae bacterium]